MPVLGQGKYLHGPGYSLRLHVYNPTQLYKLAADDNEMYACTQDHEEITHGKL